MNRAIDEVVLALFRDIIVHGKTAINNAEDIGNDEMSRAAQLLVKEGERALKRIEPVCRKIYDEHGSDFVDALMDNGPISELTEELNDLLYDFEDYVEADRFDAHQFSRLYALSRKAAPRILHIITRMKPGSPHSQDIVTSPTTENASLFSESSLPYPEGPEADGQIYEAMRHVANLDNAAALTKLPYPEDEGPQTWLVPGAWPQICHMPKEGVNRTVHRPITPSGFEVHSGRILPPNPEQTRVSFPPVPPRSPARRSNIYYDNNHLGGQPARFPGIGGIPAASANLQSRASIGSSTLVSGQSSVSDNFRVRDSYVDIVSPVSAVDSVSSGRHGQPLEVPLEVPPLFSGSTPHPPRPLIKGNYVPAKFGQDVPDGLIPVEDEDIKHSPPVPIRPPPPVPDCSIKLNSSFYHFKGFCKGSMEIIQGGLGVRRTKKQGLSGGFKEVAKCKSCPFELGWAAVEKDLNKEASENFRSSGVGFRLRFLSKSHIPAKHVGDQVYGCLFCIQLGRTTHPNDATVFFSQKQIFNHLARHPRPLPHVPGLTVVENASTGLHANNYDLHFPNSPLKPHLSTIMGDLAALPAATAVQTYRPTPTSSMKRPTDGQEVVNFAFGAKLLGVVFPERYGGEWCLAWYCAFPARPHRLSGHFMRLAISQPPQSKFVTVSTDKIDRSDHQYGAFPAEAVKLDEPAKKDGLLQGSTSRRAITRWRFSIRGETSEWLSFSKGEIITNINWSHQEHWCWSGTNSKGKTGLFPRSHIEPGSLMEVPAGSGRSSLVSREKKAGLLSRLSSRHRGSGSSALWPRESIF